MFRIIIATITMAFLWGIYFNVRMAYPTKSSENPYNAEQAHPTNGFDKPPPTPTAPETTIKE